MGSRTAATGRARKTAAPPRCAESTGRAARRTRCPAAGGAWRFATRRIVRRVTMGNPDFWLGPWRCIAKAARPDTSQKHENGRSRRAPAMHLMRAYRATTREFGVSIDERSRAPRLLTQSVSFRRKNFIGLGCLVTSALLLHSRARRGKRGCIKNGAGAGHYRKSEEAPMDLHSRWRRKVPTPRARRYACAQCGEQPVHAGMVGIGR